MFIATPLAAFVTLAMVCLQLTPLSTMGLPPALNESGQSIDFLFRLVHGLCAGVLIITSVAIAWALWRSGTAASDSRRAVYLKSTWLLELAWIAIPGALLLWLAFYQLEVWSDTRLDRPTQTVGQQTIDVPPLVLVKARQYGWEFHYAGADHKIETADDVYVENLLVVPADRDVVLKLESRDVIHSFFVPELRLKQDIVPGMSHLVWFNAKAADQLEVLCTELCGEGHYRMRARMKIVGQAKFDAWLINESAQDQPRELADFNNAPSNNEPPQ
ncbi:hypothetical protein N9L06_04530 [Mariniblastus sp.]|nr:hypothetical protein [Mariniblastus sp.]